MKTIQLRTEVPGPKSKALVARREAAIPRGPQLVTPIFAAKAEGAWIEDVDGNRYLDFAGGYGVLTRLMRDRGFDFYWQDPYCKNVFARGFEWENIKGETSSGGVTAFEVLEHVPDPLGFVRSALEQARTSNLIFSTLLYEGEPPAPEKWWYYALETGQHISFFRRDTLAIGLWKLHHRECADHFLERRALVLRRSGRGRVTLRPG